MDGTCSARGKERKYTCNVLVGNREGKRARGRWKDIEIDRKRVWIGHNRGSGQGSMTDCG
jgi:hypothetical protein